MSKEYNDRWWKPVVNPGITHGEWLEQQENKEKLKEKKEEKRKDLKNIYKER